MRRSSPIVLALLALTVAVLWWLSEQDETRAIRALDPQTRQAIYRRELDATKALCSSPSVEAAFAARCEERVLFLDRFPECDAECRRLVDANLPRPTR